MEIISTIILKRHGENNNLEKDEVEIVEEFNGDLEKSLRKEIEEEENKYNYEKGV